MKKKTLNIDNLTQLWKTATEPFNGYSTYLEFNCAFVEDTQWPNRIWTCASFSNLQLECLKYNLRTYRENSTLSLFHSENEENNLTENLGLKLKSLQYGMSLTVNRQHKVDRF